MTNKQLVYVCCTHTINRKCNYFWWFQPSHRRRRPFTTNVCIPTHERTLSYRVHQQQHINEAIKNAHERDGDDETLSAFSAYNVHIIMFSHVLFVMGTLSRESRILLHLISQIFVTGE